MQETTPKHRADWLIRYQITEVVSAMKEAEYSVDGHCRYAVPHGVDYCHAARSNPRRD